MSTHNHIQSHGHAIVVTATIAPIISAVFVGLRIYARAFLAHALGWDDCECFPPLKASPMGTRSDSTDNEKSLQS